jgi:hypothetical protein
MHSQPGKYSICQYSVFKKNTKCFTTGAEFQQYLQYLLIKTKSKLKIHSLINALYTIKRKLAIYGPMLIRPRT